MTIATLEAKLKKSGLKVEALTDAKILRGTAGMSNLPTKVVRPKTVKDVQAIQKAAHQAGVALWVAPNASGNGLLAPEVSSEPVLVDLSSMRAVIAIDPDSATALVEPGVSHADLRAALKSKGHNMWVDSGRNDAESIMGSIWDRAFGYTAYSDNVLMQCGMEIVTADGKQVRTGMGAFPKGDCWQLFKLGFGPYVDGSFMQSGLGIPTKVGLWISPAPPAYRPFAFRIDDEATMTAAVEIMRDLRINMIVPNTIVVIDGESERALLGGMPAAWNIYGALYGLPKNVDLLWGMLNGIAGKLGSAVRLENLTDAKEGPAAARAALMQGHAIAEWAHYEKSVGSRYLRLVFAMPIEGAPALKFAKRTKEVVKAAGCGVVVEQGTSWRALLSEVLISYNEGQEKSALDCGKALISEWAMQGIGVVRADPAFRKAAMATYSDAGFNKLQALLTSAIGSTDAPRQAA
jgi:4-cresol dehydrogenase (hydroxylating)